MELNGKEYREQELLTSAYIDAFLRRHPRCYLACELHNDGAFFFHAVDISLASEERNPSDDQNTISRQRLDPLSTKKKKERLRASGCSFIQKFHTNNIFGLPDPPLAIPSKHGSSLIAIKRLVIQGCPGDKEKYMVNNEESPRWDLSQLEDLEFINTRISSSITSISVQRLSSIRTLKIKGQTTIVREDAEDIARLYAANLFCSRLFLKRLFLACTRLEELEIGYNAWLLLLDPGSERASLPEWSLINPSSIEALGTNLRKLHLKEDSESDIPKFSILVPDLRRIKNCCSQLVELELGVNMREPNVSFALNTPMNLVI
jgi:hypothetical protein